MPVTDRRLVVIGGTTGLGLSAVRALEAAGAKVVVIGRETADACDPATAPAAIADCVARFGGLDGLYHVAGGSGRRFGDGPLHEITDDGWAETLQLNLSSVFYSNRAAVQQFLAQGTGGSILNLGSVLALSPSAAHFSTHAYAAAKSAILGFSRSIAARYASDDIRVNVLCPGLVDTPMARRAAENETIQNFISRKQPLDGGRIAQPADLDAAVVYFMSDASRFTTGQVLSVDGGWGVSGA
jgi:NAD(P)-dependent dehydrogenase (short-subunit alcohol dehydrogenase family)